MRVREELLVLISCLSVCSAQTQGVKKEQKKKSDIVASGTEVKRVNPCALVFRVLLTVLMI